LAADALGRCGFDPAYKLSGGAADSNVFNERGLQCVNLANGMTDIHTPDESIAVADVESMTDVTLALIDAAAAGWTRVSSRSCAARCAGPGSSRTAPRSCIARVAGAHSPSRTASR